MVAVVALVVAVVNAVWVVGWSWWVYRRAFGVSVRHEEFPPEGYTVFTLPEYRIDPDV